MTKVYIILFLFISCGVAEAGGIPTDCGSNGRQDCVMHYDQILGVEVKPVEKCELKMKEAMKLIAPYIDYGDTVSMTDALYRSPQQKLREEADRMDKRDAAIRRWNTIYQECVK